MRYQILLAILVVGIAPLFSRTAEVPEGFVPLFNGQDLSGWVSVENPKAFTVKEGSIFSTGASPYPAWIRTEKKYENFILRFEYQTVGWFEGGMLFHAPEHGPASKIGFKMHIVHERKEYGARSNGAIYDVAAPMKIANKPSGEWNACEVLCDWPRLRITLNDETIQDLNMDEHPELSERLRRGYIGIQGIGCQAYYRNLYIQELPNQERGEDLFAGTLEDFIPVSETTWTLEDGILMGKGGDGFIHTKKEFQEPYELQVWVKSQINGNGGVHFRWGNRRGHEVQVFNTPDSTNPTGSIYNIVPARKVVSRDEEWTFMQIFVDGPHAHIRVNGELIAETNELKPPYSGGIGFQQHTEGATIYYRDARVREWERR